ncbi:MAG: hypothetical protein GX321_09180 [Clostridiales bacterium]|nr:hypothetical protein [Clostridiales bacterium]
MQSIKTKTTFVLHEDVQIVYNLIFKNALYSLECYKEGGDVNLANDYSYVENITDDEGEAELFLKQLEKGKAFPVHIKDLVVDYFG